MNIFASVCDDKTIRLWDSRSKQMKLLIDIKSKARCLAFSTEGNQLTVGMEIGKIGVYNIQGKVATLVTEVQVSKKPIEALSFSPDGLKLGVACSDMKIYILDTKTFGGKAVCNGHHSKVRGKRENRFLLLYIFLICFMLSSFFSSPHNFTPKLSQLNPILQPNE